jgi:hypothetical protein
MDEKCDKTIQMDGTIFHSAIIQQTFRDNYALNSKCHVIFETMKPYRFIIVFKRLDIEFEPLCDDDNLRIIDGNSTAHPTVSGKGAFSRGNPNNVMITKHCKVVIDSCLQTKILYITNIQSLKWRFCLGLPSKICGQGKPPGSYVSKSNQLLMAFYSDFYDVRDGFEIVLTTFREGKKFIPKKIDWLFIVLRPAQEFFTDMETSPLLVKGCKI